jgi:hypothetical protein
VENDVSGIVERGILQPGRWIAKEEEPIFPDRALAMLVNKRLKCGW